MSRRRKNNRPKKTRVPVRSNNRHIVVSSIRKDPPDYKRLARAVLELAKDMREAEELGISVDEVRRMRWSVKEDR